MKYRAHAAAGVVRQTLSEHPIMTIIAWCSVLVAVALSVGTALAGASLRASLVADLELVYRDVFVVRQATGGVASCYLTERDCSRRAGADPTSLLGSLRTEYGEEHVAGALETRAKLGVRGASYGEVHLVAIDLPWLTLQPVQLVSGRPFIAADMRHAASVALVGRKVFDSLSTLSAAPPAELTLDGRHFAIIGVVDAGVTALISLNGTVVIPRAADGPWAHLARVNHMVLVGAPGGDPTAADRDIRRSELTAALRAALRLRPSQPLPLDVSGLEEQVGAIDGLWSKLRFALVQLTILLALAASVSIGALQYSVASARKHELGVRRSVGARRVDLVWEGSLEAAGIAAIGAGAGTALALAAGWIVAAVEGSSIANVGSAVMIGALPSVFFGAVAGAGAYAFFARRTPADLLARPL